MGAEQALSGQVAQTAWAVVIEPGGAYNHYRWDAARGALALGHVERPDTNGTRRDADLARLPLLSSASTTSTTSTTSTSPDDAALAASGPGLLALALASPANPAGVWLELRILGAFRLVMTRVGQPGGSAGLLTDYIALAVPIADPMLAGITAIETLTPALRERMQRALLAIAPDAAARIYQGLYEPDTLLNERNGMAGAGWLEAAAIMERYRAERVEVSRQAAERRRQEEAARAERLTTSAEAAGEALLRRLGREAAPRPAHPVAQHPDAQDVAGGWRGLAGISPAELRARGAAVYGEPEDLLRWLPARFARYLGELLFADERALFFATASALSLPGWDGLAPIRAPETKSAGSARQTARSWLPGRLFGAGRARRLHDGLLLVTDWQALLLRDYAPADGGGTHLGFLARSWPLGRLVAASAAPVGVSLAEALRAWPERVQARLCAPTPFDEAAAPPEQTARLLLALEGHDGIQVTGMAFQPEAAESVRHAAALLRGFIPLLGDAGRGDWRLRHMPRVTAWRPTSSEERELASLGGMVAPATASALLAATAVALAPGERALAQGRTPQANAAGPDVPALLTLTPERLLLAALPPGASVRLETPSLGELSSVTLTYSLMGSWLALAWPQLGASANATSICEELRVAFPSPLLTPFRALANRVRALLESGPQAGEKR